ncbi:MAG: chorismate mutase [Gemmatimonadota bacterium]
MIEGLEGPEDPGARRKLAVRPLTTWSRVGDRPLVIAGPCAAETRTQLFEVASALQGSSVDYVRAGVWKARTRPGTFDGVGDEALKWLKDAASRHELRAATEVATPEHLEKALAAGIDAVWIGARTTANPFSVQELATALRGSDVPVLVKNPISPDVALWLGALERVHSAGVRSLVAVHRGFSTVDRRRYRNHPMWQLVIELRRLAPDLPVLNDPSHIAGQRGRVAEVAQRAMDLGLDGLLVEVHPQPQNAWSDAAQQLTPDELLQLLRDLRVRKTWSEDAEFNASLEALREEIDRIDTELLEALALRMRSVERIARWKRARNVTSLQLGRWDALLADRMRKALDLRLRPEYVRKIYDVIHQESIRRQSQLMNDGTDRERGRGET